MTDWTPGRIKILRLKLGMNQTEFGTRIKVTRTSVSKYETPDPDDPNRGLRKPLDSVVELLDQLQEKYNFTTTNRGEKQ